MEGQKFSWQDASTSDCPISRGLALLGRPWALLIARDLLQGIRRFDGLHSKLGASRPVLTARLRELEAAGVIRRVPYREAGERTRHEYRLTERGLDLYPILLAIREWGERHLLDGEGTSPVSVHRGCGAMVEIDLRCAAGHIGLNVNDTEAMLDLEARSRTS